MEAGGAAAAKRAKQQRRSDAATTRGGVDHFNALPDDVVAQILSSVSTPDAVRTCVVSRRWRTVWKLLPDLNLPFVPKHAGEFRDALDSHPVRLRDLVVSGARHDAAGLSARSLATWLPAAARRVTGGFALLIGDAPTSNPPPTEDDDSPAAAAAEALQLPCFEAAAYISLRLGFLGSLAFPPPSPPAATGGASAAGGVFSSLTELSLESIRFHDPAALGDVVSSPRSPCLRTFRLVHGVDLEKLAVNSTSLVNLELQRLRGLVELTVAAPGLKELHVVDCFSPPLGAVQPPPPVLSISAPALEVLDWADTITQEALGFGHSLPHLRSLGSFLFFVFGDDDADTYNHDCLRILQGFRSIDTLKLILVVMNIEDDDHEYLMEEITMLPDLTTLHLIIVSCGHCFGDSSLQVLRNCTSIRKLVLDLSNSPESEEPCLSDCICRELSNWQTEEHVLVSLQEIEIRGFGLSGHDIGFVEHLFGWAISLTKATIFFDESVTEGVAKELCWMFHFFRMPKVHIDFRYHNNEKVLDEAEE